MSFLSTLLNFFGTKSGRDMKELAPIVDQVANYSNTLSNLSNDQLRQKTNDFKAKIDVISQEYKQKTQNLTHSIKAQTDRDTKESIYKEIDDLKQEEYAEISKKLHEIKAEAFAVIKETAQRFHNEKSIQVIATELDIKLSNQADYVNIIDQSAVWDTSWTSGGVLKNQSHYIILICSSYDFYGVENIYYIVCTTPKIT